MLSDLPALVYAVVLVFFGNSLFTLCVSPLSSELFEDMDFCHAHHLPHLGEMLEHSRHK